MEEQSIFQPVIETGPIKDIELQPRKTFISEKRHSQTTPEYLSERWVISLDKSALTLKATTRNLVILVIMRLEIRYRVDRMFMVNGLKCEMATDTLDGRCKSIHGN